MTGWERLGIGGLSQGYLSARLIGPADPNEIIIGM
jgi:hypothetical protein